MDKFLLFIHKIKIAKIYMILDQISHIFLIIVLELKHQIINTIFYLIYMLKNVFVLIGKSIKPKLYKR